MKKRARGLLRDKSVKAALQRDQHPNRNKLDPLAQAGGDCISSLCAAFDDYDRNTSKILRDYIASGRDP